MTLQNAGPSYLSLKIDEAGWCMGNSPEGHGRFVVSRLEDKDPTGVPLSHFWPAQGNAAFRRAAKQFRQDVNTSMQQDPDACAVEPDLSNWGVSRARGEWKIVGYQNYLTRICGPTSGQFVIPLAPPRELVSNEQLDLEWTEVQVLVPGALDAVRAPKHDVLAVVTADAVRLLQMENGRSTRLLGSAPIRPYAGPPAIVSSEWAVGRHVEEWSRALAPSLR